MQKKKKKCKTSNRFYVGFSHIRLIQQLEMEQRVFFFLNG